MRPADLVILVLLGAIWGGSFPLLRYAAPQFGPSALIFVRLACATLLVFSLWRVADGLRAHWRRLTVLGFINTALPFTLFAIAALKIPAGVNSLLNATTPIFGALIARLWLGERLSWRRWSGIAVAFVGIGAIVQETVGLEWRADAQALDGVLGIGAGLGAGFLYGLSVCYTRRYLIALPSTLLTAGSIGTATAMLAPVAALAWPAQLPGAGAWIAALVLGLVCTAGAYLLYFRLLKHVGASRAVTVTFLIPVFGILWGRLFFAEPVTLALLGYCAVVLLGTALAAGLFDRQVVQ